MQSRRGFFAALLGFVAGAFALPKWLRADHPTLRLAGKVVDAPVNSCQWVTYSYWVERDGDSIRFLDLWDEKKLLEPGWMVAGEPGMDKRSVRISIDGRDARSECFAANSTTGEFGCFLMEDDGRKKFDTDGRLIRVLRRPKNWSMFVDKRPMPMFGF